MLVIQLASSGAEGCKGGGDISPTLTCNSNAIVKIDIVPDE